jgi:hypothetical protein
MARPATTSLVLREGQFGQYQTAFRWRGGNTLAADAKAPMWTALARRRIAHKA